MKNRILLVDDSITIHRVIDLSLDSDNYEVEKAFTYEEAISKLRSFAPEAVLLDNKLEGVNIKDFIGEIKGKFSAKIILLVGAFDNFNEEKLKDYNCDDYLVKPFNSQLLEEKLANILPEKAGEEIVITVSEKDAAVEELMSQIGEDINLSESSEESVKFGVEDLGINIDLDNITEEKGENREEETSKVVDLTSVETEKIDDIFKGLEEVNTELLLDDVKVDVVEEKVEENNIFEEVEKELEAIKVDKVEMFEGLIQDTISEDVSSEEKLEKPVEDIVEEKIVVNDDLPQTGNVLSDEFVKIESLEFAVEDDSSIEKGVTEEIETVQAVESIVTEETLIPQEKVEELAERTMESNVLLDLGKIEQVIKDTITASLSTVTVNSDIVKSAVASIITEDMIKDVVRECLSKHLEKVVWEVVPELAEQLIIAEIEKIKSINR
ncbi:MAG: response regulator [Deferribacterales bacterium]